MVHVLNRWRRTVYLFLEQLEDRSVPSGGLADPFALPDGFLLDDPARTATAMHPAEGGDVFGGGGGRATSAPATTPATGSTLTVASTRPTTVGAVSAGEAATLAALAAHGRGGTVSPMLG